MGIKTFSQEGLREQTDNALWVGLIIRRTIRQTNITVGASAVALPTTPLSQRRVVIIFNNSTLSQILYLGNSSVTANDGFPVYPRAAITINIEDDVTLYGIASAADADIRIFEGA